MSAAASASATSTAVNRLTALHEQARGAAASTGLHTVGRNLAEHVSDHAEHLDFFSENSIGACVTCSISLVIWLVFMPIFHLGAVPWMESWEAIHSLTLMEYMHAAEETFATPHAVFEVLDADGDLNSTLAEFRGGSAIFKRPPFRYPADVYPIFNAIDANGDGLIQNTEFYRAAPSGMEGKWHVNMKDLKVRAKESYGYLDSYYTAMDINSDGQVNEQEFTNMAADLKPPVGPDDAKALFHKADSDGMGFIAPREWVSYKVEGNFTFQVSLQPGIVPTGPRVMMATEAGLRSALTIMQFDLLTIIAVEDVTKASASKSQSARLLADGPTTTVAVELTTVILRVTFQVFLGTRSRQTLMRNAVYSMPNAMYNAGFAQSISGGSTTLPAGPQTPAPAQNPGPVSGKDLEAYMNVPAIIQGHTELLLSHAKAGVHSVEEQEKALKPIFKNSIDAFCKCSINVESVQTEVVQDETGAGMPTNKSMVLSWSSDLKHGGEFERAVQDHAKQLLASIYGNIKQANLPCMVGVTLDSWTRFSATYYGSPAANLPRGTALKQRFGLFKAGMRNDTGTPPFVDHP